MFKKMEFKQYKVKSNKSNLKIVIEILQTMGAITMLLIFMTILIVRYWTTDYVPTLPQQAIANNEVKTNINEWEIVNCYYTDNNTAECIVTPPTSFNF